MYLLSWVTRLLPGGGVLSFLAPALLAVAALIAVVLTVASSEASGPPPDLGSDFNLPSFFLEQGRPAPVFAPRSPQSLPTPTPTPTATPAPTTESPCENGVVVPADISNPGLLADCELLWAMKQGFTNADEKLNWNAETSILEWDGIHCTSVRSRVVTLDLGRYASLTTGLTISYDLTGTLKMPADLVEAGGLSEAHQFDLRQNDLAGLHPHPTGQPGQAADSGLGRQQFHGLHPRFNWATWTLLEDLSLGHNQLTGSIPTSLGNLADLEELHLSYNQLSGSIPASLGKLLRLEQLDLMDNRLTGPIPSQLGNLKNHLFSLTLAHNRLSGTIPTSLSGLSKLDTLWLEGGRFSGCIPTALQNIEDHDLHSLDVNFCVEPGKQAQADDRAALVELYNSTGGENWKKQWNWLSNLPLYKWDGIGTDDEGRVTVVNLSERQVDWHLTGLAGQPLKTGTPGPVPQPRLDRPLAVHHWQPVQSETRRYGEHKIERSLTRLAGQPVQAGVYQLQWQRLDGLRTGLSGQPVSTGRTGSRLQQLNGLHTVRAG